MSQPTPPPVEPVPAPAAPIPAVPYGPPAGASDNAPDALATIDLTTANVGRNVAGTAGKWALRLVLPIVIRAVFRAIFR
jgi:hypothetical protein